MMNTASGSRPASAGVVMDNPATRLVAATIGVIVGAAGIEHGIFEILQGPLKPESIMIDAIGPAQRVWENASEPTLTLIPNVLWSGIFAVAVGVFLIVWSVFYLDRRQGALVLLLLSTLLFLGGGGFATISLSIVAFATATRIHKPLKFWRAVLRGSIQSFLSRLWPWPLVAFVVVFVTDVEIAIFGYPLLWFLGAEATSTAQWVLAYLSLALLLLAVLAGFAADLTQRNAGGFLTKGPG